MKLDMMEIETEFLASQPFDWTSLRKLRKVLLIIKTMEMNLTQLNCCSQALSQSWEFQRLISEQCEQDKKLKICLNQSVSLIK